MSKSVYFLDIDDCLIRTSRLTDKHLDVVFHELQKLNIEKAREITREFEISFNLLFDHHQGKILTPPQKIFLTDFMKKMESLEKPIIEKYGEVKKWSREIYIYLAAQKFGINLSNYMLMDITNTLWSNISQSAALYPDSLPFLKLLIQNKTPFYLITASDCRLTLNDKTGLFQYDPAYSRKLKLRRLSILTDLGIKPENIFIADPYDKPNPWVFRMAMDKAEKDLKDEKFTCAIIGDSVDNDLLPAKKVGIDKLYLMKRNMGKVDKTSGIVILNSFQDLTPFQPQGLNSFKPRV